MEFNIASNDPISEVLNWPWSKFIFYAENLTDEQQMKDEKTPNFDLDDIPDSLENVDPKQFQ